MIGNISPLRRKFKDRLQEGVGLSRFTTSRIGGIADYLIVAESKNELIDIMTTAWVNSVPVRIIAAGSNILISDKGMRNLVVVNRSSDYKISKGRYPDIWVDSGMNLHLLTNILAKNNLSGLEWASPIPGSVGGAVYGNAGAHGSEISKNFRLAEILHPITGINHWNYEQMEFAYRSTIFKIGHLQDVILAVKFQLENGVEEEIRKKMNRFTERRQSTQPTGFSVGSTFRNPPDGNAGQLIENAGLKGKSIGGAKISDLHANFIINENSATATDYLALAQLAKSEVRKIFGIALIPEFELLGDWPRQAYEIFEEEASS